MTRVLDPLAILGDVEVTPRRVEDFRPLTECLEWRLSELYWNTAGIGGFVRNEVPYTITSSGALSTQAAALLFSNCLEYRPPGPLGVLEIGAGTGLFARLFLEEFRRLCSASGVDFFSRLTYYVTDRSPESVDQWRQAGIFNDLPVITGCADGLDPLAITLSSGEPAQFASWRAIFSNYALDSMPATVLRNGANGPEELFVRTHLIADPKRMKPGFDLDLARVRRMAENTDPELLSLLHLFEFEVCFQTPGRQYAYAEEALTFAHDWPRVVLNYGATQCLEHAIEGLESCGFVLINDYGLTQAADAASLGATQRFGPSAALALNFPLLAHHFSSRGAVVLRAAQDERLPLHPMLLAKRHLPQTGGAFHQIFDWDAYQAQVSPQEAARKHVDAGRLEQAKNSYQDALRHRPRDWALMGEVGEFLIRQVADYDSGRKMAEAALSVNPWYSVWLWNIHGDALYAMERFAEAHKSYLEAERLQPDDVRTALNLGYTYWQMGQPDRALAALARGLAKDGTGVFRDRLIEKQQQILAGIAGTYRGEQEWLARRAARFSS